MFDAEETMTHEEVVSGFRKLFKRDMTPQEKLDFFLLSDTPEETEQHD